MGKKEQILKNPLELEFRADFLKVRLNQNSSSFYGKSFDGLKSNPSRAFDIV